MSFFDVQRPHRGTAKGVSKVVDELTVDMTPEMLSKAASIQMILSASCSL